MNLPAVVNNRSASTAIAALLVLPITLLPGCHSDSTMQVSANHIDAPIPDEIRQIAALGSVPLEVLISVNNEVVQQIPVTAPVADTLSARVNIPAVQDNNIQIAWFAVTGGTRVLLADYSTVVAAGTTEISVSSYNNSGSRFDADNDGLSNLKEAIENRNLLSQYDLEAPFQNTFGGAFASIIDDGIDPDVSGDTIESDAVTTFSLRHDGSDLIVYVCGQDQTLQGDNFASDGQYWHDDVVFIFLDGADSNNSNFDGVDDFQLAFIRESGDMIVSKGANNAFCSAGECISHSFFNNTSSCKYELTVNLPIADLNMSVDTPIGFDIEITDDDNGDLRESSSAWIGYNDRSNLNPNTFGTIRLK